MINLPPTCHPPARKRASRAIKFSVSQIQHKGKARWVVCYFVDGKRKRSFHNGKSAAQAEVVRLREELAGAGEEWLALAPRDRQRIMWIVHEAQAVGADLGEVWEFWKAHKQDAPSGEVTLGVAISALLEAKRSSGRARLYIDNLRLLLGQFAKGRESMSLGAIGLAEIESWLAGKSAASRSTLRARLWTLFRFAVRRGWRPDNPCERLEALTIPAKPPAIFTVEQARRCFGLLAKSRALGWFVLSTLCGLRPSEAEQTAWAAVNFEEGWIRVEAQTSKIRQRRVVYPLPVAMAWLKAAKRAKAELPLGHQAKRRAVRRLRDALEWKAWPKDITRHTAASYWLALDGDPAKVAAQLGHSPATLARHYKALVTRAEAEEFWAMAPQ